MRTALLSRSFGRTVYGLRLRCHRWRRSWQHGAKLVLNVISRTPLSTQAGFVSNTDGRDDIKGMDEAQHQKHRRGAAGSLKPSSLKPNKRFTEN